MTEFHVHWKQWVFIDFLVAEGQKPIWIHEHVLRMCGEQLGMWVLFSNTLRRIQEAQTGVAELLDERRGVVFAPC
jgi:hypothetical protein